MGGKFTDPEGANCLTLKLEKEYKMKIKGIRILPINSLTKFNPEEFCIATSYHGFNNFFDCPFVEEAKNLARILNDICIAVVETNEGDFALAESCNKGLSNKFLLFNAVEDDDGAIRAITFNTGTGALTSYWFDKCISYKAGSIV